MSAPLLLPYDASYGLEMLIRWLIPLDGEDHVGPSLELGAVYPFRVVSDDIGGVDDKVSDRSIYTVETFAQGATRREALLAARDAGDVTHRRMLALGPPLAAQERVTLADGRIVFADEVVTSLRPRWEPWGTNDLVQRVIARYAVTIRFISAQT